jgi:hypothetical protein
MGGATRVGPARLTRDPAPRNLTPAPRCANR